MSNQKISRAESERLLIVNDGTLRSKILNLLFSAKKHMETIDIANAVGTTRTTVNRTIRKIEDDNFASFDVIKIGDGKRLTNAYLLVSIHTETKKERPVKTKKKITWQEVNRSICI